MQKLSSESWNVLGDVYLDAFHCCGDFLVFEVQLFILDYNRSIVLNATLEYYPDRVKGTKSEMQFTEPLLDKLTIRCIEQDEAIVTEVNLAGVEQVL